MEVLKINNVSKDFGGLRVLDSISFSINAGEKAAIIGPNGAGKTTLINIISGVLSPTSGEIIICGHRATNAPSYKRCEFGMGRSFQLNSLFFETPLIENVLLICQGRKSNWYKTIVTFDQKEFLSIAEDLLGKVGLWNKRGIPPKYLSYGEQRLAEIILAMALKPKLLVLDEPSAGLSVSETSNLIKILNEITEDVGLFFCAHDMDLVLELASRVIALFYGQIICDGTPEQVTNDPKVKEIYLGISNENTGTK